MMDVPLDAWLLFERAPRHFADVEVVTQIAGGERLRQTYGSIGARAQQLMHALDHLGVEPGARVASLAWNSGRHLELYFGVPCSSRVLHTVNVRLSADEVAFIFQDAQDVAVFVDPDLLPLLEDVAARGGLANVEHVVVLGDDAGATSLPNAVAYEDLIADEPTTYRHPVIDERSPMGLCYTSGTTGRPKGVEYSHRSTVLHALVAATGSALGIGPSDCTLPVVPMFHANAWGVPHAATAVGAKQVFLAGSVDAGELAQLLDEEDVTVAAGVPTVWLALAEELAARPRRLPSMRHLACGGAQPPRAMIERYRTEFGLDIVQAWGMTETSPLASLAWPKHALRTLSDEDLAIRVRSQAGLPLPGVTVSIRSEGDGSEQPWDGASMGELCVRGPWVTDRYLHDAGQEAFTDDGFFRTGDMAIGSPDGYFVIADRSKDLIKSGGEWISSVDLEAAIMGIDDVDEAVVIAVPDPKWQERPLACVVPRPGAAVTLDHVRAHLLAAGFAKWQLPDRLELLDEIPRTSVGKFDKKVLRARFG
jgi:acyl-CoA synthetase (AMP-forming)/AMP-acid ligase II